MAQKLMTPGVYIEEVNAFPGSVVEVATAIPAFIGYTEKATRNGKSLVNIPTRITSFADYLELFGGSISPMFKLVAVGEDSKNKHVISINNVERAIEYEDHNQLFLFNSIKFFFSNGGGTCYIVSVGTFGEDGKKEIKKDELLGTSKNKEGKLIEGGLKTLLKEQEPTMIVIPDAVALGDDAYEVYKQVLAHCAKMQSRIAILDIHDGDGQRINNDNVDVVKKFREKIGTEFLNYAAAYYPWLNTNIVQKGEITFDNLTTNLGELLPESEEEAHTLIDHFTSDEDEIIKKLIEDKPAELEDALIQDYPAELKKPDDSSVPNEPEPLENLDDAATPEQKEEYKTKLEEYKKAKKAFDDQKKAYDAEFKKFDNKKNEIISKLSDALKNERLKETRKLLSNYKDNKKRNFHLGLMATSPTYANLLDEIRGVMNILPPSAAIAGIYTMVDNNRGVWKAPANVGMNSVIKPTLNITHDDQENLNVDATSGKSINAIRTFPGVGTLIWGARTLDGNSLDWRYINVRRTMIMLEQSIKMALRSYVFEPNDANTWVTVKSMIVNFLTEKWKQGALAGSSPDDAFNVEVGLGTTMTSLDILEGKMLVTVKLAIVRPAEFIVVTFEQQMQKS
ncbi:phage tail sheath C-terminal domain-containing protein [Saccharicrinis sp. 156]|uniref:phage tail sheath family protein n=1 Tax=Saccharicrinis sp. 156 TaxID=3417574 RepID=UPI003D33489E